MRTNHGRPTISNSSIASLLKGVSDLLDLKGESVYRVAAYREAARRIEHWPEDVAAMDRENRLREIPGVGESIAAKIHEYLTTGKVQYYEDLKREISPEVSELLDVPGLGPRKAMLVHEKLGIDSVDALEQAAREHRLSHMPGIGAKTEDKLLREIRRLHQRSRRLMIDVALRAAEDVVAELRGHRAVQSIEPAGSLRRRKETIGDIDILVASTEPEAVADAFVTLPLVKEVLAKGPTRCSILNHDNLQVDLRIVDPSTYGAALQYFTGSKEHNIALRTLALSKGYSISEYGVFEVKTGRRVAGQSEEEVYSILGMQYIPPELRENRGEIPAALNDALPDLITQDQIKGDLHCHSDWSDGSVRIADMVEAAIELGYEYIAISDHSKSLGIAHGLSVERVREQQNLIRMLNNKYAPFRILCGTEVDILRDGTIDYPEDVLRTFDFVTASIHSGFHQSRKAITGRIVRAMANPYVDVISHPTGRLIAKREPYEVDLEEVLRTAARTGTAMEINSSPDRLDLDDVWSKRAKELGVQLVVNTDAHSPSQMLFMRYGIFVARRGWLAATNVLNTRAWNSIKRKEQRKSA